MYFSFGPCGRLYAGKWHREMPHYFLLGGLQLNEEDV